MMNMDRTTSQRSQISINGETGYFTVCHGRGIRRKVLTPCFILYVMAIVFPCQGYAASPTYPISPDVKTTRQQTVRPILLPESSVQLTIDQVEQYAPNGYSMWTFGDGVDAGPLLPDGAVPGNYNPGERLLTFFAMTDIHIVDKESPGQSIFAALMPPRGFGNTNTSAYSPIMLSTTHVLDAAVQTINTLHRSRTPFDFGITLGDHANSNQYNELRWFINVMDGKKITPSSGSHRGARSIDYQKPYRSAGLDKSIPWFATIGNHDQYWCGTLPFNDYTRSVLVGTTVLNLNTTPPDSPMGFPDLDSRGIYAGILDGKSEFGTPKAYGLAANMQAPVVAADRKRHALSTPKSTSLNWMKEFFKTTSKPKGHGFTQANLDNDFTSYTFEPKPTLPLKVIVLDDTCKLNPDGVYSSYARACLDQTRYDWLVNELDRGQAEGKLMIIAAHVPVGPRFNVPDAPIVPPQNIPNSEVVPLFLSTCLTGQTPDGPCEPIPPYTVVTDESLLAKLHEYPNLLLWISGHRHINTVSPQPAPVNKGPEFGFWEVETSSLRDFPQQFRTFEIVRNDNNTVSIFVTDVDPAVQSESPAAKSRGYAIGASRISAGAPAAFTDDSPHAYNAELIKPLPTPYTITVKVAGSGTVTSSPYTGVDCAAGQTCSTAYLPGTQITLVATPSVGAAFAGWTTCTGKANCSLTLNSDTAVTATFTRAPTLAVTPSFKNFGIQKVGVKVTTVFSVTNTAAKGIADLSIGSAAVGGPDTGQFKIVEGKDHCSGKTLKPGKSCKFYVSFMPKSDNTKTAAITIPSNDTNTPEVIPLTGAGQ